MEISELEDKISDLDNRIDELRFELNQQVGFIAEAITQLDEDFITTAIINNRLPYSIKEYIVNNYKEFSRIIVSTLLESEYFHANNLFRCDLNFHKTRYAEILEEYYYLEYVLVNPNLSPYYKEEIKKRIAKHKRDLKKQ
jgi:hypothetical protein